MQQAHRLLGTLGRNDDTRADVGGRNHRDVDAALGKRAEHLRRDAGVDLHARADDGDLGDLVGDEQLACTQLAHDAIHDLGRFLDIGLRTRERDVSVTVLGKVLDDHVDAKVGIGHRAEDLCGNTRGIGHVANRELGFRKVMRNAADNRLFHSGVILLHQRARLIAKRRAAMYHHAKVTRELDAALVQHAHTTRGHLEHFLVANLVNLAGTRNDARICRVDAGDVRTLSVMRPI